MRPLWTFPSMEQPSTRQFAEPLSVMPWSVFPSVVPLAYGKVAAAAVTMPAKQCEYTTLVETSELKPWDALA